MKNVLSLPFVSVIIVNYNGKNYLKPLFDSLYNLDYPQKNIEIIVVDNGSTDGSLELISENHPKVKIICNDVNNYCRANNLGIKESNGNYLAFLNNDVVVDKHWLSGLIKVMHQDEAIGAVGSKILFMDGRINSVGHRQLANYYWEDIGFKEADSGQYNKVCEVSSICGAAGFYKKEALQEAGCFDEDFNIYLEDVDIAFRLKNAGWKILLSPGSLVYHKFHGTNSAELVDSLIERNRLFLIAKHFPERLPESLFGRGYFTLSNSKSRLIEILPYVINKLIKHHKGERAGSLLPGLFNSLNKIFELDKNHSLKTELDKIYNSETYRLIVKPIWKILNFLKPAPPGEKILSEDKILFIKPQQIPLDSIEEVIYDFKKDNPSAHASLLANLLLKDFKKLLQNTKIDEKLCYCPGIKNFSFKEQLGLIYILRKRKFSSAIILTGRSYYPGYTKASVFAFLSGATKIKEICIVDNFENPRFLQQKEIGRLKLAKDVAKLALFSLKILLNSFISFIKLFILLIITCFFLTIIFCQIKIRRMIYKLNSSFKK